MSFIGLGDKSPKIITYDNHVYLRKEIISFETILLTSLRLSEVNGTACFRMK